MSCGSVRRARPLLGTLVEITLAGMDEEALHEAADAAFAGISRIHDLMSLQDANSELCRLNATAYLTPCEVSTHTWNVLSLALEISSLSDGVFDVTLGGAIPGNPDKHGSEMPRSDEHVSYLDVELLPDSRVWFQRPLSVDVGGIAKGYAVDHAINILRDMGVPSASVNAGGDIRAFGAESVPVQVRDPANPAMIRATVDLLDGALATSAVYPDESHFSAAGTVIDPRRRQPLAPGRSASVRAASCAVADALAKCVLLLGEGSTSILSRYGADGFVIDGDGAFVVGSDMPAKEKQSGQVNAEPACSMADPPEGAHMRGVVA